MGFILSKFKRAKPSTKEQLEIIDKDLRSIQRFQLETELTQKRIIGRLILFSSLIYIFALFWFYFFGPTNEDVQVRLLYIVPFIAFPPLMWAFRFLIIWYYSQTMIRNREKYEKLKGEKQKILEEVMDKETFKVAKEILEKYAPGQLLPKHLMSQEKMGFALSPSPGPGQGSAPMARMPDTGLRRRNNQPPFQTPSGPGPRPNLAIMPSYPVNTPRPPHNPSNFRPRGPIPMPLPMLPPSNPVFHRRPLSWMDKVVDYVVGDGPASRYALICSYCATHNGLATAEDFPYTSYRCVFCRQFNPSKQVRPAAAKLPEHTVQFEELENSHDEGPIIETPESSFDATKRRSSNTSEDANQAANEQSEHENEENGHTNEEPNETEETETTEKYEKNEQEVPTKAEPEIDEVTD